MIQDQNLKQVRAGVLDIAYFELGPKDGTPTILLHGFPYDAHAYDGWQATLPPRGTAASYHSFAATARPASCRPRRCALVSRRPWAQLSRR